MMKTVGLFFLATVLSLNGFAQKCNGITWESITDPGPYNYNILTEGDGMRNGPDYNGATVYYPVDAEPPFASIVLSPGYWTGQESVADWGPFYASHGFVAMTIGTNFPWDYPDTRAEGLLDAIETLRQEDTREASPLFGNLDLERFVASGWSMGGGGAQRAAVMDGSLKAVVAMTPWLSTTFENASYLNHAVPVLILSGEDDPTAPPNSHADRHYSWTPSTTNKLKFEVSNGDHHVADGAYGANGDLGKVVISWLRYHLYDELCYCPLFSIAPLTASEYLTNVDCGAVTSAEDLTYSASSIKIYPNPVGNYLQIEATLSSPAPYRLFSMLGEEVQAGRIDPSNPAINLTGLSPNMYVLQIGEESVRLVKSVLPY